MNLTIIVAIGANGEIGKNNDLLWHLPEDMKFFKDTTQNSTVIMGRKNWDSIPEKYRPLSDRVNIVLTKNKDFSSEGALVFNEFEECLNHCEVKNTKKVFIIGGAQIYKLALAANCVDKMLITHVHASFDADTYFPAWDKEEWKENTLKDFKANDKNPCSFTIIEYTKK